MGITGRRRVGATKAQPKRRSEQREKGFYSQQSPVEKALENPSIYLHCILNRSFFRVDIGPWPLLMPLLHS